MMKKFLYAALALFFCVGLMLGGCEKKSTEDMVHLTISEVTHSVFYAPQYAAIALGYFQEEGLEIELVNGGGADNVMTAVLSGQVEIGFAGPEASIYVYNEGKEDFAQVFAQVTKRDGSFIMARTPNPNFTYEDFEGAHILGGRKGGVPYMTLEYVIKQSDADINAMNLDTSIDFDLMVPSFTAGTGDYVTVFEPVASTLEQEGKAYIVASVGQDSGEIPFTAYFALKSYIQENPEVIQKFTDALYRAQQWVLQADAEEIAEVIAPFFPDNDIDLLTNAIQRYQDIDAWVGEPAMTQDAFERLQDVMQEAGELKQRAPYSEIVNNDFAYHAVE